MNGEEAAASLFGSEDSGSDLFATLGADTTSPQPVETNTNLFSNETSSHASHADANDFQPGTQTYGGFTTDFPSNHTGTQTYAAPDTVNPVQNQPGNEHGEWRDYGRDDLTSAYAAPNTQPNGPQVINATYTNNYVPSTYSAESSAYPNYDAYNPPTQHHAPALHSSYESYNSPAAVQSYAPQGHGAYDPSSAPQSAHTPYTPPTSTTQSYTSYERPTVVSSKSTYGAYDPPTPASRTTHSAYDPPGSKIAFAQSPTNPSTSTILTRSYEPHHTSAGFNAEGYSPYTSSNLQGNTRPAPNVPPLAKSTVPRPKVSNAYDPPFPVTLPNRKGGRLTAASAYAQYQKPVEVYHEPGLESPTSQPDSHRTQPAFLHDEIPNSTGGNGYAVEAILSQPSTYSAEMFGSETTSESHPSDTMSYGVLHGDESPGTGNSVIGNDVEIPDYNPEDTTKAPRAESDATSPVLTPYPPPSSQSTYSNTQPKSTSHSSIPLSLSHSSPSEELQEYTGHRLSHNDAPNKVGSQQGSYVPQPGVKKDASQIKEYHDPYAPKSVHNSNNYIPRTSSPLSLYNGRNDPKKPSLNHANTMSSPPFASVPKPLGGTSMKLYTPSNTTHDPTLSSQSSQWQEVYAGPQELTVKSTAGQYAPSPSLIGANDPLSRTSARAPIVTFGFGGKIVTCFHGMPGLNAGFDVAFSSRTTSELKIRIFHKTLPESALTPSESSYPGPLFADPGSTSMSLVRPNVVTQTKNKKASVLNYLSGRVSEIHQGLGYLSGTEKQTAEDKYILVKLLSIMVENDGRLLGTTQSELAVRSTLVPRLEGAPIIQDAVSIQASFRSAPPDEVPISVTSLRASALDKIEEFLLRGDRRQAYQYAAEEKLWAHAMVISSSIDKESWKEVVHDFLRIELAAKEETDNTFLSANGNAPSTHTQTNNRESLRVAYSLFSGQGPAAIQEMVSTSLLQRGLGRFQSPMVPTTTPRTPNFTAIQPTSVATTVPPATLAKWGETAAMILGSPLTSEASAALTALGDQLLANNRVEAAHVCYLLSPQTSLFGGLGSPSTKFTLLGSKNPVNIMKDPDALIFSEILEFALSLVPIAKGQEPFHGIPHLQAYRFIKTVTLAEVGDIQLANRYCEAITICLSQISPYTNLALVDQLQGLQQRLSGIYPGDKGNSWIGGKIGKPSLDSIGGWLEGRFTKLVTGESETTVSTGDPSKAVDQPFVGPFAHYSNISSTTPSARSSPQPQLPPSTFSMGPPQRTSSAMATTTPYSQQVHVERSSSAMDHIRQRPTVNTYAPSSNSLSSSQSSPIGFGLNTHSHSSDPYASKKQGNAIPDNELETPVQTVQKASWWGSSHEANELNSTPTAATFLKVDESTIQASDDGLLSLMDNHAFSVGPSRHASHFASPAQHLDDDLDDDLGLGNSKPKPKSERDENSPINDEAAVPPPKAPGGSPPNPEPAPAANSGSWLGRWWKRSDSTTPGPIKASLGEESAFYYDKEQKRWVNRKAGSVEAEKPAPPPPSRAQTASPGMTGSKPQPPSGSAPPLRSASAIDLGEPPIKAPMRIRSNLAPPTLDSAPSTPTGTRMNTGGPPPARPKSQATKRPVRSRYVDVFQQEAGGA